jgi:hypothetical protein
MPVPGEPNYQRDPRAWYLWKQLQDAQQRSPAPAWPLPAQGPDPRNRSHGPGATQPAPAAVWGFDPNGSPTAALKETKMGAPALAPAPAPAGDGMVTLPDYGAKTPPKSPQASTLISSSNAAQQAPSSDPGVQQAVQGAQPGAEAPGINGWGAAAGAGLYLGGTILGTIGQMQGAKGVEEAQEGILAREQAAYDEENALTQTMLARRNPGGTVAGAQQGGVQRRLRAVAPAAAAGAKALGMSASGAGNALARQTPGMRVDAGREGLQRLHSTDALALTQLGGQRADIRDANELQRLLDEQRIAEGGRRGQLLRQFGQTATTLGPAVFNHSVA